MIDNVVGLCLNGDKRVHRIKWYSSANDEKYAFETTKNSARSKILSYYMSGKLDVPSDIDFAIDR